MQSERGQQHKHRPNIDHTVRCPLLTSDAMAIRAQRSMLTVPLLAAVLAASAFVLASAAENIGSHQGSALQGVYGQRDLRFLTTTGNSTCDKMDFAAPQAMALAIVSRDALK